MAGCQMNCHTVPVVVTTVINSFQTISDSSSSSDSDEEFEYLHLQIIEAVSVKNKTKRHKVEGYFETISCRYSSADFRSHFRLTRESVKELLEILNEHKPWLNGKERRPKVCQEKALLLCLWALSNQESFRGVADLFGVGKGHAHRIFLSMCKDISAVTHKFIKWPTGNDLNRVLQEFEDLREQPGFPSVVGCIDGTHIEVPGPKGDNSFYNRKKYHSVIVQGVCDARGAFIDIYTGWPGSVHDARVWRNSPLCKKLEDDPNMLPKHAHLLGDSAYPLAENLMTVYKDNGFLTPKQKKYNSFLSTKRVVIENAFGRLKQSFRRLKYLDIVRFDNIKFVVLASCVCHNIMTWQSSYDDDDDGDASVEFDAGLRVDQVDNHEGVLNDGNRTAKQKRDSIADLLFTM